MSGIVLTGHGGPDKLEWREDIDLPSPAKGEVLIKVAAAGVNNTDINTRVGWYSKTGKAGEEGSWGGTPLVFPRIQGADVCGHIAQVGEGVPATRIGERVIIEPSLVEARGETLESPWYFGSECDGGFAQYTCVASRHAFAIDSPLSDAELASFPCSWSTAENMLTRCAVTDRDVVLVTGASGGVGSAAVQLARARGAEVIAVTGKTKARDLMAAGANSTVDRAEPLRDQIAENSVDVVIDLVAGPDWPACLEVLKPKGRYGVSGAIAGPLVTLDVRTLYLKDLSFFGCTVLEPEVFGNLVQRIENGDVRPLVARTFDLRDIHVAQEEFQAKTHIGKIVLEVA